MQFSKDDKVNINQDSVLKIYGISKDHVFSVVSTNKDGSVKLNNGWYIDPKYLVRVAAQPSPVSTGRIFLTNDELEDLVVKQLDKLAHDRQMFTSYDVTKELRNQNPNLNIAHDKVKQIVEDLYDVEYDLTRSLIDIATPNPWLYHAYGENPDDYVKQNTATPVSQTKAPKVLTMTINFK